MNIIIGYIHQRVMFMLLGYYQLERHGAYLKLPSLVLIRHQNSGITTEIDWKSDQSNENQHEFIIEIPWVNEWIPA